MHAWLAFSHANWVIFSVCVLFFLALDLGAFHKESHEVSFKESLSWTLLWVLLGLGFMGYIAWAQGGKAATQFFTGYALELSLSIDNVFVIVLIFLQFKVPKQYQHSVLFWGVIGALAMRGLMIGLGVALINRFDWILYVFGGFLILTGIKMSLTSGEGGDPSKNKMVILAKKFLPISQDYDGQKFVTRIDGRKMVTPLFLVLLLVEASDLIFALDSVPAIFGVTRSPFFGVHLKRVCHPRAALDVLRPRRCGGLLPLPQVWNFGGAGFHWCENAD